MWYALREAYADRLLTLQPAESYLRAVLVNETASAWITEVHARRLGLHGQLLAEVRLPVTAEARSMAAVPLPASVGVPSHATDEVLIVDAGDRRSVWTWLPDRDLAYPPADADATVTADATGYIVSVTARSLLRDVCLFPDRLHPDATVDAMLRTLLPGESATFVVVSPPLEDPSLLTARPVLRCVNDTARA